MSWNERIKEAAYISPGGTRIIFDYENVSKSFDKKTSAFEFPDADGTYVQDLGNSGRRYPLRVFFWGDDYDLNAEFFEVMLQERGIGKLEHPIYGTINVVPFGTITRRDDLKTAANQAVFDVTFWETIDLIYPVSQNDPASDVLTAVDEYNDAAAGEFDDSISLDTAVDQISFSSAYTSLLDTVSGGLQAIADFQTDVQSQFNAINDSINQGIDILIGQPLTLAFQTMQLIQAPARALDSIDARLDAYDNLLNSIIDGDDSISTTSNQYRVADLYASTYVSASIISVINNQFTTRGDALTAAENIIQQFDDVTAWRDNNLQALSEVDVGNAYQQLQQAVSLTAGFLVQISFTLYQERRLVLDQPRTIVDLAAQLYGVVDDRLDFLINSNDLSGSEILEIPKGREIVYYI